MNVTGTQTVQTVVKVEISPVEVWDKLRKLILRKYHLQDAEYLRYDTQNRPQFKADEEHRHGSISERVVICAPNEQQVEVWKALKELERLAKFDTLEQHQLG